MLASVRVGRQAVTRLSRPTSTESVQFLASKGIRRSREPRIWVEKRRFASIGGPEQDVVIHKGGSSGQDVLPPPSLAREHVRKLPIVCPGCGAPSQTVDADSAGFYGSKRAIRMTHRKASADEEDAIFDKALKSGLLQMEISDDQQPSKSQTQTSSTPICDRCHYLIYQSRGTSIVHPSMQSIEQIISESPHKLNHIYHVLDAADFPLSLIPNLQSSLHLPRLRTQNRRSKSSNYIRGRVAEVSFIITRSDLLAPKKEQVDALVPYLREVLREALGRAGHNVRLGNVRCVSAHRGWWTKTLKEEIYNRGGAGWVVGKVNVGKSALFEAVFPKGRNHEQVNVKTEREKEKRESAVRETVTTAEVLSARTAVANDQNGFTSLPGDLGEPVPKSLTPAFYDPNAINGDNSDVISKDLEEAVGNPNEGIEETIEDDDVLFDDGSLLPPLQPETAYPTMPIVSSLPGTTASPIRIPFGNGKGELIDLPGVNRSSLEKYVKPEHRKELIMRSRVVPEQHTIKPGQSLLLGGLIKITPKIDDLVVLACPFLPIQPHVTSNEKATAIQTGVHSESGEAYEGSVSTMATSSTQGMIKSAGTFSLKWDVTKRRSGPLTASDAGQMRAKNLPFLVYGADILIEGVGWVELTCQVRKNRPIFTSESFQDSLGQSTVRREIESGFPELEIWSPEGKFVGIRPPMNAWLLGGPKKPAKHAKRLRPRQTISFKRRQEGGRKGGAKMLENVE